MIKIIIWHPKIQIKVSVINDILRKGLLKSDVPQTTALEFMLKIINIVNK